MKSRKKLEVKKYVSSSDLACCFTIGTYLFQYSVKLIRKLNNCTTPPVINFENVFTLFRRAISIFASTHHSFIPYLLTLLREAVLCLK